MIGQSNLPHLALTLETGGPYKANGTIVIYRSPNGVDLEPVGEFRIVNGASQGEPVMYSKDPTDIQLVTDGTLMAKEGSGFELVPTMVSWAANQLSQSTTILKARPKASPAAESLAPAWLSDSAPYIIAGGLLVVIVGYAIYSRSTSSTIEE